MSAYQNSVHLQANAQSQKKKIHRCVRAVLFDARLFVIRMLRKMDFFFFPDLNAGGGAQVQADRGRDA